MFPTTGYLLPPATGYLFSPAAGRLQGTYSHRLQGTYFHQRQVDYRVLILTRQQQPDCRALPSAGGESTAGYLLSAVAGYLFPPALGRLQGTRSRRRQGDCRVLLSDHYRVLTSTTPLSTTGYLFLLVASRLQGTYLLVLPSSNATTGYLFPTTGYLLPATAGYLSSPSASRLQGTTHFPLQGTRSQPVNRRVPISTTPVSTTGYPSPPRGPCAWLAGSPAGRLQGTCPPVDRLLRASEGKRPLQGTYSSGRGLGRQPAARPLSLSLSLSEAHTQSVGEKPRVLAARGPLSS